MKVVAMARHGPILNDNEAMGSGKVFKYLPGLRDTITKIRKGPAKSQNPKIPRVTIYSYIDKLPIHRPGGLIFTVRPKVPESIRDSTADYKLAPSTALQPRRCGGGNGEGLSLTLVFNPREGTAKGSVMVGAGGGRCV